jgi:hypothetical protein
LWWPFPLRWPLIPVEFAPPRTLRTRLLSGTNSRTNARANPGKLLVLEILRPIVPDVLPAVGRCVSAGSVARGPFRLRPAFGLAGGLLVERLFGDPEGVDCSRHPAVENHLGDYLGDFLLSYADIQGPGNVPLDHLGAVAQNYQCSDGAEAAGLQVDSGSVINFTVDNRIHQAHHIRGQLSHGRRRLRVVVWPVVAHTEFSGGGFQVHRVFLVIAFVFQLAFQVRLIRAQERVVVVVVSGGHSIHLVVEAMRWFIESARSGGLPS